MSREIIQPEGVWDPRPRFAQVVKTGNQVYIAGQTAVDEKGNVVDTYDTSFGVRTIELNRA